MYCRIDLPDFFKSDGIMLCCGVFIQPELFYQSFTQMTTAPFGKHGIFCFKQHTRHIAVFFRAISSDAHIAGNNAAHAAIVVVAHICGSKTRKYFNAHAFGLLSKPAAQIPQRDNIVTFIVHGFRRNQIR